MKMYKLMADVARNKVLCHKYVDTGVPETSTVPMSAADMAEFWKRYEEAKVFVFDSHTWDIPSEASIKLVATDEPDLDVPFRACSFESLPHDGKEYLISIEQDSKAGYFLSVLLYEIEPKKFDVYGIGGKPAKMVYIPWREGKGNPIAWVNILWIDRLNRSSLGVEHVNDKVKVGTGSEKRFHKIRQIIRVVPKNLKGNVPAAFSREIDWSHRWTVRGHWRKVGGLGKNRAGEYCVEGFTWVTDFVKGPESAPLVEKVRFVQGA